jgi:hypothetical protein
MERNDAMFADDALGKDKIAKNFIIRELAATNARENAFEFLRNAKVRNLQGQCGRK